MLQQCQHGTSRAAELLRPLPKGTSEEMAMSKPTITPLSGWGGKRRQQRHMGATMLPLLMHTTLRTLPQSKHTHAQQPACTAPTACTHSPPPHTHTLHVQPPASTATSKHIPHSCTTTSMQSHQHVQVHESRSQTAPELSDVLCNDTGHVVDPAALGLGLQGTRRTVQMHSEKRSTHTGYSFTECVAPSRQ
jgi:hypothetical protein